MIRSWLQSPLAREGAVKAGATVSVAALGFVSSALLARSMSQSELGTFVLVLSVLQLCTLIADAGVSQAATRFVAAVDGSGARGRVVAQTLRARALVTAVTLVLYALVAPPVLPHVVGPERTSQILLPLVGLILLRATFLLWPALERGQRRWRAEGGALIAEAGGLAGLYGLALLRGTASVPWLMRGLLALYAMLAAGSLAMALRAAATGRNRSRHPDAVVSNGKDEPAGDVPTVGRMLRFGVPLMVNGSLFFALVTLDRILLGSMRSPEELATYYVAVGLVTAGRLGFSVLEHVLYSHLAATCRPDSPHVGAVFRRVFSMFAAGALGACVVGAALGRVVIPAVYGKAYAASVQPFVLLLVVLGIRVMSIPASLFLIVVHQRPRRTQDALMLAFVASMGLNLALIPRWGIWGAIAASLVGFGIGTAHQLRTVAGLGLRPGRRLLRWFLPAASSWALVAVATQCGWLPQWAFWAVEVAVGVLLASALTGHESALWRWRPLQREAQA